ncbi:MAG: GHKL domain-containing protein, partial [Clostridiales bacterium]|nr:GHKL domain-containing protein [Clostridiales bacterium]
GITFTVRDITADKELREKIIMKDKLESIGRLTTSIAHEIRNPISSIKTYVELLPSKYDNEEFRNTISKDVPYQIQRLDNLITNLLNYSKPAKSQRKVVVLNDVILSSMQLVNQKIISKNISIQVNLIDDIKVYVDQYQLEQVLLNLLLNTIDAVEDVQSPNIEILSLVSNDKVILKIIDNGIGIPDMVKKQIFEPFYTTKLNGYGLGLSIVHQLTKENGIEISVDSAVDVGTTFELSFSIGRKE